MDSHVKEYISLRRESIAGDKSIKSILQMRIGWNVRRERRSELEKPYTNGIF